MSKQSLVQVVGNVYGDGIVEAFGKYSPIMMSNADAPGGVPNKYPLQSGDNVFTVPVGSTWVMIVPPSSSVVTKKLKGNAGDVGVPFGPAGFLVFGLPVGSTSFIVNAAVVETVDVYWG